MGKSCWMARLALQQHFPTQILLVFLSIKIATKFYIPMLQTSNLAVLLILFPALSVFSIHNVLGILKMVGHVTLSCKMLIRFVLF